MYNLSTVAVRYCCNNLFKFFSCILLIHTTVCNQVIWKYNEQLRDWIRDYSECNICVVFAQKYTCILWLFIGNAWLTLNTLNAGENFSRYFFLLFPENRIWHFMQLVSLTICMECQILFSGKNLINMSNAESAHSMVSVKALIKTAAVFF